MSTRTTVSIKEVIETLSHLLYYHQHPKTTAECFRLAKFNRPEARDPLLKLLYSVLKISDTYDLLLLLVRLDYPRSALFLKTGEIDSAELLLCLGFLIEKLNLIAHLRQDALSMVSKKLLQNLTPSDFYFPEELCKSSNVDINTVLVLKRKIDLSFAALSASVRHLEKITERASKIYTSEILAELGKSNGFPMDFILHRDLKLQHSLLATVSEQVLLLKLHERWLKCEDVFWQWLVSVPRTNNHLLQVKMITPKHKPNKFLTLTPCVLRFLQIPFNQCQASQESLVKDDVASKLKETKDRYRIWLSTFLEENFPSLIEIPPPSK